jgi:ribonuclease Y
MTATTAVLLFAEALLLAGIVAFLVGRASRSDPLRQSESCRERLLAAARSEAELLRREMAMEEEAAARKLRAEVEGEIRARRQELEQKAAELAARTAAADRREEEIKNERAELARRETQLTSREQAVETALCAAAAQVAEARARVERCAGLSAAEARKELEAELREEVRLEVADEVRRIEDEARLGAAERARNLVAAAVQRHASEFVVERTVAVVALPSDDMKGRIIGREGRNIRSLEAATGVDIIIDDTPAAVVISCFNPVRREIARLALTRLIADGRIHPSRIEETVEKVKEEVERHCEEAAEQAAFDLGLGQLHPELLRLLGKLKFRSSQAQNLLQHSIEVGFLAGAMAAELEVPVKLARRAGLLHDIGQAADHEIEGSHAAVGALLARKYGESAAVCQAIEAHHGDLASRETLDHLIDAANVLSGQRPGARREMLETFVQRLSDLEKIAASFPGVEKAFAIQAGRELRVLVENARVSDEEARELSKSIARRVEAEANHPGPIRVAVVRETRATEYAK